jgi:hypothetical protein
MFFEDGRWKEFGVSSPDHTVFPFWLFCIVWGLFSYLVVFVAIGDDIPATAAAVAATTVAATPTVAESPEDLLMPLPPKSQGRNANRVSQRVAQVEEGDMKPGYYILDPKGSRMNGIPRYIYIGPEPADADAEAEERNA